MYTYILRGIHSTCRTPDGGSILDPHILFTFPVEVIEIKRSLLIAFCLVLCASTAFAQRGLGSIDVFTDLTSFSCDFTDTGGLLQVHVFVTHANDGTTAAQWMMKIPSAWTYLGTTSPFQTVIGDPLNGISIAYGQCLTGDFLIATVNFLGDGGSPVCSHIRIVPDPTAPSGLIEIVDCQTEPEKWLFYPLGVGVVNGDARCPCGGWPWPVQETTWGKVKALYQ